MRDGILKPFSPFNTAISDENWQGYIQRFNFPVSGLYTCTFLEPKPKSWVGYGLFNLLMEELVGGDYLLKIAVDDNPGKLLIERGRKYRSPKEYRYPL